MSNLFKIWDFFIRWNSWNWIQKCESHWNVKYSLNEICCCVYIWNDVVKFFEGYNYIFEIFDYPAKKNIQNHSKVKHKKTKLQRCKVKKHLKYPDVVRLWPGKQKLWRSNKIIYDESFGSQEYLRYTPRKKDGIV